MANHRTALKDLNLKTTPKRLAILDLLSQEQTYVSPEDIWQRLKVKFSRIGLPTVYRILDELAEGGIISKVIHPNRQLYYYFCPNRDHHHHFICLSCRKVEDVDFCGLDQIERQVSEQMGGRVLSHIVQVNGLCRTCAVAPEGGHEGVAI